MPERLSRDPGAELDPPGMPSGEAAGGVLGDDEVGRTELSGRQQTTDERVHPGVRRVRDDAEGMTGPAEGGEVDLDDRDPRSGEACAQFRCSRRVQLHGEHPGSRPLQRRGQGAVAGTEVHHDVTAPHRGRGDEPVGPVRKEWVPSPAPRRGRGHGSP